MLVIILIDLLKTNPSICFRFRPRCVPYAPQPDISITWSDKKVKMSNKSQSQQTLLDIFQEILAASGNSSDVINETQIVSVMREQSRYGGNDLEATLMKMMKDARMKLNFTLTCDYCMGDVWDVVHAYNGIHGYVSLLVSLLSILHKYCVLCYSIFNTDLRLRHAVTTIILFRKDSFLIENSYFKV